MNRGTTATVLAEPALSAAESDPVAEEQRLLGECEAAIGKSDQQVRGADALAAADSQNVARLTAMLDAATNPEEQSRVAQQLAGARLLLDRRQDHAESLKRERHVLQGRRAELAAIVLEAQRRAIVARRTEALERDAEKISADCDALAARFADFQAAVADVWPSARSGETSVLGELRDSVTSKVMGLAYKK